jgi:excisionase family DNA binding protein
VREWPEEGVRLMTLEEVQWRLGIGRTHVFRLISDGELECVKIGKSTRVPSDALDAYVAGLRGRSGQA